MKITKRAISIFLLAFLIGYISVPPRKKIYPSIEIVNVISSNLPVSESDTKFKPEIFDVIDVWEQEEPKFKINLIDIIEIGNNYQRDEIKAKSGETWLGFYKEKDKDHLRYTKIKVRPEQRPNYGYANSVTIKVNNKTEPVFLLKNAKTLREGEIKTLFNRPSYEEAEQLEIELTLLKQGFVQDFQLGDRKYTFRVKEGLSRSHEKILALVLETELTSQIIHFTYYHEPNDYVGSLLWVGDLDHDGKLDLYMDFYNYEKGGFGSGLFLSSEAEKGKLVKQVAYFGTLGC